MESATQRPYTVDLHFTTTGPSGASCYWNGYDIVHSVECVEGATFAPSLWERAGECADFFTRHTQNPYKAVLDGNTLKITPIR